MCGAQGLHQLARLGRGHGQRLLGDDVLAGGDGRHGDLVVQDVGCAVVHHLDGGIAHQVAPVSVGAGDVKRPRLGVGGGLARLGQSHHLDVAQAA